MSITGRAEEKIEKEFEEIDSGKLKKIEKLRKRLEKCMTVNDAAYVKL